MWHAPAARGELKGSVQVQPIDAVDLEQPGRGVKFQRSAPGPRGLATRSLDRAKGHGGPRAARRAPCAWTQACSAAPSRHYPPLHHEREGRPAFPGMRRQRVRLDVAAAEVVDRRSGVAEYVEAVVVGPALERDQLEVAVVIDVDGGEQVEAAAAHHLLAGDPRLAEVPHCD